MRKHEIEIEIAAPASEVWKALTTAQGIASWFAPGAAVEPGAGGKMTISWGEGMEFTTRIPIWEPERHLQTASDRPEPAPPNVIDYFIESRGGTTVLRLVHSGFDASADFDAEYDSTGYGWAIFMKLLKHSAERGIDVCRNVTSCAW
ncbi:MAG: SRPBCC domain-containing protein [Ignavibacteriota bacterium]